MVAPGNAHASPPRPAGLTWAQVNAMPPDQVAALQNPLIAIADPISSAGATMAGLYSAIALDTPGHAVDVYVTDTAQAGRLLRAAKAGQPGLDLSGVRVMEAPYSLAALTAAAHRLVAASTAGHLPFRIYAIVQAGPGQGLELQVPDPATAGEQSGRPLAALGGRSVRRLAGVTLTFARGMPMVAATTRENGVAPFIGGDYATGRNVPEHDHTYCTAGIPVENSSGQDGLIEAGHCVTPGNGVFTLGGHLIGTASPVADRYDAEIIWTGKYHGQGSKADEVQSDTSGGGVRYFPLVDVAGPFPGEDVCQDGISSFLLGRGVPCNITVRSPATYYLCPLADGRCGYVNGYDADSNNGRPIVAAGDSGAVVFTMRNARTRNAVGMIDASTSGCNPDCHHLAFVTQAAIMSSLDVHLNPHE